MFNKSVKSANHFLLPSLRKKAFILPPLRKIFSIEFFWWMLFMKLTNVIRYMTAFQF